jgi:hypothetical protein
LSARTAPTADAGHFRFAIVRCATPPCSRKHSANRVGVTKRIAHAVSYTSNERDRTPDEPGLMDPEGKLSSRRKKSQQNNERAFVRHRRRSATRVPSALRRNAGRSLALTRATMTRHCHGAPGRVRHVFLRRARLLALPRPLRCAAAPATRGMKNCLRRKASRRHQCVFIVEQRFIQSRMVARGGSPAHGCR